jgi:ABC-2 type transport system permease protein
MNWAMVRRLIWKDWYLNRVAILVSIVGGMVTLAAVAMMHGAQIATIMGIIVVVTILIGMGAVVMVSAATERKEQTLAFTMSLPISHLEYTASKLVGGLLIYLVLWTALVVDIVGTILLAPGYPHGLIPFVLIMSVEILMTTSLVTAVSVTTESMGWTIATIQVGAIGLNGIGWWIVRFPEIGGSMTRATIEWSRLATVLLTSEIAAIVLTIAVTFFVQARKRGFV